MNVIPNQFYLPFYPKCRLHLEVKNCKKFPKIFNRGSTFQKMIKELIFAIHANFVQGRNAHKKGKEILRKTANRMLDQSSIITRPLRIFLFFILKECNVSKR